MTVADRVAAALAEAGVDRGPVVVGVSGGVDSVVLLRTLHRLGVSVIAAHVDHGLRDPTADVAFVRALAAELGVPVDVQAVRLGPGNVQAEARRARYAALATVAKREGARVVAVGHTATDQAETVLLHLVRGAGLRGLAGLARRRALAPDLDLVRPLLDVTRTDVEALARAEGWAWQEDPSNAKDTFARNRLRHRVLPELEEEGGPGTVRRMAHTASVAREAVEAVDSLVEKELGEANHGGRLALSAVAGLPRREVWASALTRLTPSGPRHAAILDSVDALVDRPVGSRVVLPGLTVWRERGALRFQMDTSEAEVVTALRGDGPAALATPDGVLHIDPARCRPSPDPFVECADASALGGAVTLRPWQVGDRFRPLGLDGSVLVSDLLTGRRVPPSERSRQRVLCGADGAIVWVVGHRLAAAAAVTDATADRVALRWVPAIAGPGGGG